MPAGPISIGDEAPDFDLSSTEGAVLSLRDEVARTAVVVYLFADPADERARRDLDALHSHRDRLAGRHARVLAVSPAKLDALRALQAERHLSFPLLHDDRGLSAAYGLTAPEEGRPPAPALVVVSRRQRILWFAHPVAAVAEALPQVDKVLESQPSPARSYPQSVINRLIDRWVS